MSGKEERENIVFVEEDDPEYLDSDEFETICETRWDFEEPDVDAFWNKGWSLTLDHEFARNDADYCEGRWWRTFPTRYRLEEFRLSKSLRRVMNRNRDLKWVVRPFRTGTRKQSLYAKHYVARYGEKPYQTLAEKYRYPGLFWTKTMELSIFKNRQLVACSVFEVARRSVQSNSAFWDLNEPKRSLGILTVLLEMQYAIRKRKKFYHLGAYYPQNPNYQYKTRFSALDLFDWEKNDWVDFKKAGYLLEQRLKRKDVLPPFKLEKLLWLLPAPAHGTLFPEIVGIALFGSQARGAARPDSDFDVLIVTPDIDVHFRDDHYASCFGSFRYARREKWFSGETLRSFFREEHGQIEYNFVKPAWAELPPNDEARRIFGDGAQILHDPHGVLERLQTAVLSAR